VKKLVQNGNVYTIVNSKAFQNKNRFKDETIDGVFDFAYSMTFGEGEHRDHRRGGTLAIKKGKSLRIHCKENWRNWQSITYFAQPIERSI
jgi:hypothetical protein